ncbi:MAG: NAD(P)H-dependent oxidoreductase [Kiloniellales bacterium]
MTAQMKNFLDQTGALWASGALVGKAGSVFSFSATQHDGRESTILTVHPVMLHLNLAPIGAQAITQAQNSAAPSIEPSARL